MHQRSVMLTVITHFRRRGPLVRSGKIAFGGAVREYGLLTVCSGEVILLLILLLLLLVMLIVHIILSISCTDNKIERKQYSANVII